MPGMHGNYTAVTAMQKSDLLISLGVRFDDRVTGKLATFAPNAKIIHADIDPAEIGKNRAVDVPIVGDARSVIHELNEVARGDDRGARPARLRGVDQDGAGVAEEVPVHATRRPPTARSSPSTSSSRSARSPTATRSTWPASASTRCGLRSTSASSARTPGSTRAGSARWATRSPPRWAPRSAAPTSRSGPSTATAASR